MKCHISVLCLVSLALAVSGDAELPADLRPEGRAAKPEPFLDKIAHALFGSSNAEKKNGPPKPSPVYRPQKPDLSAQASYQSPVKVRPPQYRPQPPKAPTFPKPPPKYTPQAVSASNSVPSFIAPQSPAPFQQASSNDPWQIAQPANMAQIVDLQVQCEKDLMRVRIQFNRPFYGMVFSKGHYSNINCVHVPSGLGQTQATFDISLQSCGMTSSTNDGYGSPTPQGSFIENTIIIQYDPLLQEVWDQARKLRCTWYDFYEKAVTFKPYQVDMLDPVTANFLGDNLRCWMQIQVGKGPYASEVSGIVKIGQTMTMVLGVKDDENKFDMMVRNCVAHDGNRAPIQLVDEKGCVARPKIMSPFKKIKNFDATANVLAYAYFQAFKFPDSMNVHFQCVVQVCRGSCPDPQCGSGVSLPVVQPAVPAVDTYGTPQAPAIDSYGSPVGAPLGGPINSAVNPRVPVGGDQFYQGSEQKLTIVKPDGSPVSKFGIPIANSKQDRIELSEPGYESDLLKRVGSLDRVSLTDGRPRSLDGEEPRAGKAVEDNDIAEAGNGDDSELKSRRKRAPLDANGNRILHVVRRDATDTADVETEKVIQVLAPNDVQFALTTEDKEEVVINTNTSPQDALCVNTAAFVAVVVTMLMILIIALITILFLWHRIKTFSAKGHM